MSEFFKSLQDSFRKMSDPEYLARGLDAAALNKAVRDKDYERIDALIKSGKYDVNAAGLLGEAPFHQAVRAGDAKLARFLIDRGADPTLPPKGAHSSSFSLAVTAGHPHMVTFLKSAGARLDVVSNNGTTALMQAVDEDKPEMITALIRAGADPLFRSTGGRTPALVAVQRNQPECIRALLAEPAAHKSFFPAYYPDDDPPMIVAVHRNHIEMVEDMIAAGISVNEISSKGLLPLEAAMNGRNLQMMTLLLKNGADPVKTKNGQGDTVFHTLCRQLYNMSKEFFAEAFDLLVDYGAVGGAPNKAGITPIYLLSDSVHLTKERFERLLETTRDIHAAAPPEVMSLPELFVRKKYRSCLKLMLDNGHISINDRYGDRQETLLHIATRMQHLSMAEMLMKYDPDLTLSDTDGWTPPRIAREQIDDSFYRLMMPHDMPAFKPSNKKPPRPPRG